MKLRNLLLSAARDTALADRGVDREVRVADAGTVDRAHLSTPPKIGSSIPRLAIMSAT